MFRSSLALALLSAASFSAHATVLVEAQSSSMAQAGPQPVSSFAQVLNGALYSLNLAGPNGSSSAGPIGPGATSAFADTTQIDGTVLSTSLATADLATGRLGNYAEAGTGGASTVIANSRWIETVTFNNSTGATVELGFFWQTDGAVTDQNGPLFGSQNITSSIQMSVNNTNFSSIQFKGQPGGGLGDAQYNYGPGGSYFTFSPNASNSDGVWTATPILQDGGLLAATLLVPAGLASIDITASLRIDCRGGSICDYSNTASFGFGALPNGLSWTSESGVFLSAVPIPASMGLFVSGICFVAATAKRWRFTA